MSRCLLIIISIFFLNVARSDEDYTLPAIQVRAHKAPSEFTFTSNEVLDEEDLKTAPMASVAQSLSKVKGLFFAQNGGPGAATSFFMRGTESRHVAFLFDGVKLNDPSAPTRQFDAAYLLSPDVESIEVFKGPQPVLFGSDAIGGLVYIHSRKGADIPSTRINLGGGSFGTRQLFIGQDWLTEKNRGTVTVGAFQTDGISHLNEKRFGFTRANPTETYMATSSSAHGWSERISTDLLLKFIKGTTALDDAFNGENSHDESQSEQYLVQQKTSYRIDEKSNLNLRTSFNRHNRMIDTLSLGKTSFEGSISQADMFFKFQKSDHQYLAGIMTEHESTEERSIDRSFHLHSLYLQSLFDIHGLKFQVGGREDYHQKYGGFFTWSSGISYQWDKVKGKIQYSEGYKAPTLYQLYGFFGGTLDLTPEKNRAWETGLEGKTKLGNWDVTLFENKLSNLIINVNDGTLFGTNRNQGAFTVQGIEVGADIPIKESIRVRPAYTHQKFSQNETPVIRRPQNMASLQMSYFPQEATEIYSFFKWVGPRKDLNFPEVVKIDSYEVINAGMRHRISKYELGLHVLNVTDRKYEDLYGFSVMPLSVFADLRIEMAN